MTVSTQNNACNAQVIPAKRAFHINGTPYSPLFNDIYHSAQGAFEQAQHVFIQGNDLTRRWMHHSSRSFVIVETGFGLGVNFLATWMAWKQASHSNTRLHFVSIEKHPFTQSDLYELLLSISPSSLRPLIEDLCSQWPVLTPGLHRLEFDKGQVVLTLCLGDVRAILPQLQLQADAFYLDGFSPDKNPDMWEPEVGRAIARLAVKGATLATYTVASKVRKTLTQAGFEVHQVPGFNTKRTMLVGQFVPRWQKPRHSSIKLPSYAHSERHALVIGAGIAGCAITHTLSQRGWEISLLDQCKHAAQQTSSISLGLFHPAITQDNSLFARTTRAGFLFALQHFKKLSAASTSGNEIWRATGLIKIAKNEEEANRLHTLAQQFAYPENFAIPVSAQKASELAGTTIPRGGWYFPEAGWVNPSSLCLEQLTQAGPNLKTYFEKQVAQLIWHSNRWHALDETGCVIAHAPIAILASAQGTSSLLKGLNTHLPPTQNIRGQISTLACPPWHHLNLPIIGDGYITPLPNSEGLCKELLIGASYDRENSNTQPDLSSYHSNLAHLAELLPDFMHSKSNETDQSKALQNTAHDARLLHEQVGFRCASVDRLPLLGAIFQQVAWHPTQASNAGAHLTDFPRFPGLLGAWAYGSRGLIWATLAAELIASQLEGEPLPIERSITSAFDPARFFLRQFRRAYTV